MPLSRLKIGLQSHGQRLRFLATGAFNTAVGLAFFPALLMVSPWLYMNYIVGLVISQVVCTIIAFTTYKFMVFIESKGNIFKEFLTFVSFYVVHYAMNIIALPALVKGVGISPIIAQFGFSVVLIISGYFWHSFVTFRTDKNVREHESWQK